MYCQSYICSLYTISYIPRNANRLPQAGAGVRFYVRPGSNERDSASSTRKVQPCHPERSEGSRCPGGHNANGVIMCCCHPERSEGSRGPVENDLAYPRQTDCHPERSEGSRSPGGHNANSVMCRCHPEHSEGSRGRPKSSSPFLAGADLSS